jgi:hypothetical protein
MKTSIVTFAAALANTASDKAAREMVAEVDRLSVEARR